MEITYLKNHLNKKAGDTANVSNERGNYLVRIGVASSDLVVIKNETTKTTESKKGGRKSKK